MRRHCAALRLRRSGWAAASPCMSMTAALLGSARGRACPAADDVAGGTLHGAARIANGPLHQPSRNAAPSRLWFAPEAASRCTSPSSLPSDLLCFPACTHAHTLACIPSSRAPSPCVRRRTPHPGIVDQTHPLLTRSLAPLSSLPPCPQGAAAVTDAEDDDTKADTVRLALPMHHTRRRPRACFAPTRPALLRLPSFLVRACLGRALPRRPRLLPPAFR